MSEDKTIKAPTSMHQADYIRVSSYIEQLQYFVSFLRRGTIFPFIENVYPVLYSLYYEWKEKLGEVESKKFKEKLDNFFVLIQDYKEDTLAELEAIGESLPPPIDILHQIDSLMMLVFKYKNALYDSKNLEQGDNFSLTD